MKKLVTSCLVLGALVSFASADVFTNKDCNDPVKINALKTYYKDFLKNEGKPAPTFEGVKFSLYAENMGKNIFKTIKPEDAYICRAGGMGAGTEFLMVRADGKIYIYDRQYSFDSYKNDTFSLDFVRKYGVVLK